MKLITKDTDNAIAALIALARCREPGMSAADLSAQLRIPYPFMRRILQTLASRGIVTSRRGTGGGFTLVRPLKSISVGNIVEIFQGSIALLNCGVGKQVCEQKGRCVLRRKLQKLESKLIEDLMGIALVSLTEEETIKKEANT